MTTAIDRIQTRLEQTALPTRQVAGVRASVPLARFRIHLTSLSELEGELLALGYSGEELHRLLLSAQLDQDHEDKSRFLVELRRLARAKKIGRGMFITALVETGWPMVGAVALADLELSLPVEPETPPPHS